MVLFASKSLSDKVYPSKSLSARVYLISVFEAKSLSLLFYLMVLFQLKSLSKRIQKFILQKFILREVYPIGSLSYWKFILASLSEEFTWITLSEKVYLVPEFIWRSLSGARVYLKSLSESLSGCRVPAKKFILLVYLVVIFPKTQFIGKSASLSWLSFSCLSWV